MNKFGAVGAGIVVLLVLGAIALFPMYINASNSEIGLRNQSKAQDRNMTVVFDNTFKIIQQQAGVTKEYKGAFAKIYPDLMKGRNYGGELMKFVMEANPEFKTSMYEKLMDSIEIQRNVFTREQQKAIDIKREHDNLRTLFPTSLFVGSRPELEIRLVTSTKTEEAFNTGKDDDIDLFKDK
jgi:hypothetical protein